MVKVIRKDLVQRMQNRIIAEDIMEQFVNQLIHSNDAGGAYEFIHTDKFYLQLEDKKVICDRKANKIYLGKEEFSYDVTYLTYLCLSLLDDEI